MKPKCLCCGVKPIKLMKCAKGLDVYFCSMKCGYNHGVVIQSSFPDSWCIDCLVWHHDGVCPYEVKEE